MGGQTRGYKKLNVRGRTYKKRGGGDAPLPPIHIVYFTFFDRNERAHKLITEQMKGLRDIGLAAAAKSIHIVLSTPKTSNFNNSSEEKLHEVESLIHSILPSAEVHVSSGNRYEYPGIRKVWSIAKKIPAELSKQSLILYFHSKGMTSGNTARVKTSQNETLTNVVINPWKEIVARFESDPVVEKAGFAASSNGFIWFNFWWARASYIAGCPRPILTERRHYYEDWLGRRARDANTNHEPGEFKSADNCLSLCVDGPEGPLGVGISAKMEKCKILI
jgi:hypothetical protein